MSGPALISERTGSNLRVVTEFFGIDMEWNRHIFRHAAQSDGPAFEAVMRLLAEAIMQDSRRGITGRIREDIAKGKGRK